MKTAIAIWTIDRVLLAIYLVALLVLLIAPIPGPEYRLLGIGADKWMHFALFGGLAVLLRWNLSTSRHAVFVCIGAASVVAGATEIVQSLVDYRSAELWDLLAGVLGATLGAVVTNQIVSSPVLQKIVGLLVVILGLILAAVFVFADLIGVGQSSPFGTLQIIGTALGALITAGGIGIYVKGLRGQ